MSLDLLLVEGKLDAEILGAVLAGRPTVKLGGSKSQLAARVKQLRETSGASRTASISACYLRDRDFDFPIPTDLGPVVDQFQRSGVARIVLGWRWSRHEIENYLLEPAVVCAATSIDPPEYASALIKAAGRIQHYQAARWTIGLCRTTLPPNYTLETRPRDLREYRLPESLSEEWARSWATTTIGEFYQRISDSLGASPCSAELERQITQCKSIVAGGVDPILTGFAGKDLFAGLADWLNAQSMTVRTFLNRLRDWVILNADEAVALLPEWAALRTVVEG